MQTPGSSNKSISRYWTGVGKETYDYEDGSRYEGDVLNSMRHGKGKMTYSSGAIYEGEWVEGKFHGKGVLRKDDTVYEGDWISGKRQGKGKKTYANGEVYVGDWFDSKRHGKGQCVYSDGDIYIGEWSNDNRHGYGKCTLFEGSTYEGEWANDMHHGKGKFSWPDGESYDGDWVENTMTGKGTYIYPSGNIYTGDWKYDEHDGKGEFKYADGSSYSGSWKRGKMHGYGTFTSASGKERYEGSFIEGRMEGQGTKYFPSGAYYSGNFVTDKFEGIGEMHFADGRIYVGNWSNGFMNGQGKMTYSDGSIYIGERKNGKKHGEGTLEYFDGRKFSGHWKSGKKNGLGKMIYGGGTVYEGGWLEDEKEGYGVMSFADGRIYTGQWHHGKMSGHGKKIFADSDVYEGNFEEGVISGHGEILFADGTSFIGNFVDGKMNGKGIYKFSEGSMYEGEMFNDHMHGEGKMLFSDGRTYLGSFNFDKLSGRGLMIYPDRSSEEGIWVDDILQPGSIHHPAPEFDKESDPHIPDLHKDRIELLISSYSNTMMTPTKPPITPENKSPTQHRLLLHFDVNKTVIMTDMGVTIEDTFNKVIAECVWGYIKEGTNLHTRGPNEWTLVSTEPSSNPPNFENIKLYTFGDYLDNHTKLSKADKRKYKFSFTSKGSIGESFEKYYQSLYDAMKPTKDIISSANENNLSFLSNGFYQIVPSFFKLLVELEQKKVEYSIVFRTFGEDTPKIAEELNLFCEGKHPICSKLDEFKQMNGNNDTIDRRLYLPQFNGKVLRNDDDVTFVTVNNNNIIEAYDGYDEFNRILFEWTKNGKTASIQDDYHYWASHAEDDHSGKLLILQKEDSKIKQLFFDDNIEYDHAHIVDVRDHNYKPIPFSTTKNVCLFKIQPYEAIIDPNYYIKLIQNELIDDRI